MANPELPQDRVQDLFDLFESSRVGMFHQQYMIYDRLAMVIPDSHKVIEAGCGVGLGSALVAKTHKDFAATDKDARHTDFARCLYPWINFAAWDITKSCRGGGVDFRSANDVVCVECIEHIDDVNEALDNLCAVTLETLWISTPNGNNQPSTPLNPHHVREYTPGEMLDMLSPYSDRVEILDWSTFEPIPEGVDTMVTPLVYKIKMRKE